ncbi:carboxypeptidase B-like [Diadema antillarum]|uniref:carboxypeptidase B-like n=1 Tax=Diadema antillarum TaxID=105358 RepID=UPI003A8A9124
MTTRCLLVLLISVVYFASAKYEGYQVWRITPTSNGHSEWLVDLQSKSGYDLDFWTDISRIPGHPVDIMVPPRRQSHLRQLMSHLDLNFDVMMDDVSSSVSNHMSAILKRREEKGAPSTALNDFNYYVYHTYDEIQQWVTDIVAENSDILTPFLLGHSYEGREINGFKIRGTGSTEENPPAVWFEGGIHAREWISPATVMGFTQKLIDDYRANDQLVVDMFDNIDWYIVPSLNVDGYAFTWEEDRLWRKTRTPNERSSCIGTDGNRNWPYEWGGVGTSPWACSDIYHGSNALSEVEIWAVVNFLREKKAQGQDFKLFIDWHSYTQIIIAPWSYTETNYRTDDYDAQMAMAASMSSAIFDVHGMTYRYGAGNDISYPAAGSSKDWGYGDFDPLGEDTDGGLGARYAYTVELRDTGDYGFLLPEDQIQPTIEEIHAAVRAIGNHLVNELGSSG